MSDLKSHHIETLVKHFYQRVNQDDLLSPVFNEVAEVDWEHHIPLLCQFWNSIMLKTNEYHGGAYMQHLLISQKTKISEAHFTRWLLLFSEEAVKHLPIYAAEEIIEKATLIGNSLKYGMLSQQKRQA